MAQPIWNTPAGVIGTYPYGIAMTYAVSASPVLPATSITYALISGTLPAGLTFNVNGTISGTPTLVVLATTSSFTIRATDNLGNLRDRTFTLTISGTASPTFATTQGSILSTLDSVWIEYPIQYNNPDPLNPVLIQVTEGLLPPGLEINDSGVIMGYPQPPVVNVTLPVVYTSATATSSSTNEITCFSTASFTVGRPIVFTGTTFGTIVANTTYYIASITSSTTITIALTQNGSVYPLSDGTGTMDVTLPDISVGEPTIITYSFGLSLSSPLGDDNATYSITVTNQNTPVSQGGPGYPPNSRVPTILNTRPLTINISPTDPYYGYYILPPVSPTTDASFGFVQSGDQIAFKIIGNDFDANPLTYSYSNLPPGLVGDPSTGWIYGTITLPTASVSQFNFSVAVYKSGQPSIASPYFNYSCVVYYTNPTVRGVITWVTPTNLGTIFNGSLSTLSVLATSDIGLQYRIVEGSLPPNLTLADTGEILGKVAIQPTDVLLDTGDSTVYTFTVEAYSPLYSVVQSTQTFTLTVYQEYSQPTDTLYIKATPSVSDRILIGSLLNDDTLIPPESIYRPSDIYFGKASSVIYEHAYGIYASDIQEYIAAVTQNHYWRNITLGQIKTAVARDSSGNIIYEVVYSQVIDNLVNPKGQSIPIHIGWPRPIDLGLGPWYSSVTDIYTSYDDSLAPGYYTSRTPGYTYDLYPNSLPDMRQRVANILGQQYDSNLLPLWMTSQQLDGSTLGYTPAWVICYTVPGASTAIMNNIVNNWGYTDAQGNFINYRLNQVNFQLDRFSVDKSDTYNYNNLFNPPAWTGLPSGTPVPNPIDSNDFYVLFPRQTILPDQSEY